MNDFKILLQAVLDANSIGESDIKKIQKVIEKYHLNLTADLDKAGIISEIKKIVPELEAELKKITGVDIQINDDALIKAFNQIERQAEKTAQSINKIQHSLDVGDYDTQFKTFETALKKVGIEGQELENKLNGVKTKLDELKLSATDENIIPSTVVENARLLDIEIEKISNDIKNIKLDKSLMADELRVNDTITKLNEQLRKNSKYSSEAKTKIEAWIRELEEGDIAEARLKAINSEAKALHAQMGKLGKIGKSVWQTFTAGIRSFAEWMSASGAFMEVVQGARYMYDAVLDIDTAMTNLYKVTDETSERYNKFLNSACDNAQRLGRTVSSLVEQTANWSKLGYSLDDAEKLAEISSIYANVGEVDDATAVSDMVTAMKAFNIEASDAITIVDMLNTLGKVNCPFI